MPSAVKSDIEIAREGVKRPIAEIAARLGIPDDAVQPYGRYKAKVDPALAHAGRSKQGKLILVTAITPTPPGEGKTTTTVGLGDALNRIGKQTITTLDLEAAQKIAKLVEVLEDDDDVQSVTGNFDIPDEIAEQL